MRGFGLDWERASSAHGMLPHGAGRSSVSVHHALAPAVPCIPTPSLQFHASVDSFKWPQNLSDPSVSSLGRSLLSYLSQTRAEETMARAVGTQVEARLRQGLQPHGISARILRTKVVPAGSAPGLKCAGECLAAPLAGRGVAEEVRAGGWHATGPLAPLC